MKPYLSASRTYPRTYPRTYWHSFFVLLFLTSVSSYSYQPLYAQGAYEQLQPSAQTIVALINQARAQYNLPALQVNPLLNAAAQGHVNDMITHNWYGHIGSDGSTLRQRLARVGYPLNWVGENWISSADANGALQWWLSDPPHRANILQANFTEIGIGYAEQGTLDLFVTDFGQNGDLANNPPPPAAPVQPIQPVVQALAAPINTLPAVGVDYTIQSGDTLLAVGLRHGVGWSTIAQVNGLTSASVLQIGQVIHIPGANSWQSNSQAGDLDAFSGSYTIQAGDTLLTISIQYGITWEELGAANQLGGYDILEIGQVVRVPQRSTKPAEAPSYHSVASGDTVVGIATRYQMDWQVLMTLNGLNENSVLQIGQQIRIQ